MSFQVVFIERSPPCLRPAASKGQENAAFFEYCPISTRWPLWIATSCPERRSLSTEQGQEGGGEKPAGKAVKMKGKGQRERRFPENSPPPLPFPDRETLPSLFLFLLVNLWFFGLVYKPGRKGFPRRPYMSIKAVRAGYTKPVILPNLGRE